MSLSLLSASSWYFSQIYLTKNTGERKMQHDGNDQLTPEFENKRGWSKMIFLKDQQGNQKVQAFLLVPHNMAACGAIIRLGWSSPPQYQYWQSLLNTALSRCCCCYSFAATSQESLAQLPSCKRKRIHGMARLCNQSNPYPYTDLIYRKALKSQVLQKYTIKTSKYQIKTQRRFWVVFWDWHRFCSLQDFIFHRLCKIKLAPEPGRQLTCLAQWSMLVVE